jgi:hypothetical protein
MAADKSGAAGDQHACHGLVSRFRNSHDLPVGLRANFETTTLEHDLIIWNQIMLSIV